MFVLDLGEIEGFPNPRQRDWLSVFKEFVLDLGKRRGYQDNNNVSFVFQVFVLDLRK